MSHSILFRKVPWVQDADSTTSKIFGVSRYHGQSMDQSRGRHQPICIGQSFIKTQSAPFLRDPIRNWKNSASKLDHCGFQPSLKNCRLHGIFSALKFDSIPNFTQAKHADVQICRFHSAPPPHHILICTAAFANFGKHIRVQKVAAHKSKAGRLEELLGRSNNTSSSTSERAARWALKSYRAAWSTLLSFSAKIRRCSSSVETPCAAARSFSAFTSSSEIFLTNN